MAFWSVDLTTRDGAESAASLGGIACFISAGLTVLGMIFIGAVQAQAGLESIITLVSVGIEAAIFLLAGWRLRKGKGLILGGISALMMLYEGVFKLMSLSIGGVVINAVLLVVMVNGLRGAWTLRRGMSDPTEISDVFN